MAMPHRSSTPRRPSRAPSSTSRSSYGLFIDGDVRRPGRRRRVQDGQPGHRGGARRGRRGRRRPTSTARSRRPAARTAARGRGCPAASAAKYLFRIARLIQERVARARRARDARQRQADQGVARRRHPAGRRALLLLRRLGRQARARRARPGPAAARRRRPGHPVELPAAHAGLEDRAGAGRRQHRRAQAGRDDAADRAASSPRSASRPTCRPASSTSSPAPARPGRRSSSTPDVDKVAFTGSTEVGKAIARAVAGTGKKVTLELGGKAANIVFDDAPIDQAVEGIVNGIFFNQGHVCCAGSRLLVQESVADEVLRTAQAPAWPRCASATRSTRTPTSARSTPPRSSRAIRELADVGEAEGARALVAAVRAARRTGFWFAPTVFTGVTQAHRIAREEIFGPVLSVLTFRTPDGGRREGQQHARTACRPASGPRRARGSCGWPAGCAPASSGPTRSTGSTRPSPFGGYKESGYGREGGRHGLEAYLDIGAGR